MENDYNYGGQPGGGYDPNSGVDLNKDAANGMNAGYDANSGYTANAGYDANANGGYGTADNNGFDSFGNPVSNMNDYGMTQNQGSSTLAIVSLVCGLVGLIVSCCCCLGLVSGIAAIITGALSIKKQNPGKGMAIAGIITGAVAVVLYLILWIIGMVTGASESFMEGFMEGMESCIRFF